MTSIAKNLTELIGNTPLLELSRFNANKGLNATLMAKIEFFNPGGSVKDRIALSMIEDAEAKGLLKTRGRYHRTHQRKYRCRIGVGIDRKRIPSDIDHARNNERRTPKLIKSIRGSI